MMQSTPRFVLWAVVLSVFYSIQAAAQDYSIADYIVSGTGCPAGTVDGTISSSGQAISLAFSNFVAEAGQGYTLSDGRKNCQITLEVDVPAGYQFSIGKVEYDGSYSLGANTTAIYSTTSYFQASTAQGSGSHKVNGPASASNTVTNTVSPAVWSPCGKNALINVNNVVRLSGASSRSGQVTLDSLNISENSFVWRTC